MKAFIQAHIPKEAKSRLKAKLALEGQTIKDWLMLKVEEELGKPNANFTALEEEQTSTE